MGDLKDRFNKARDSFNDAYDDGSSRYSNYSDEQLKKEVKKQFDRPDSADKYGRIGALKDEYDSRH